MANFVFWYLCDCLSMMILWFHNPDHLDTLQNIKVLSYTLNNENAAMKFMHLLHLRGVNIY